MRLHFLHAADAKRYTQHLTQRYGIPPALMKEWVWYGHAQNVYVVTQPFLEKGTNIYAAGMLAFTDGKAFAPTTNFISSLGKHIAQNHLDLDEKTITSFFARHALSRDTLNLKHVQSIGYVAVRLNGQVVASANLTQTHLIPNLPSPEHGPRET